MTSKTHEARLKLDEAGQFFAKHGYTWQHYKGGVYQVNDRVISTIDGEITIIYQRIDGPDFDSWIEQDIRYARPFAEWQDLVLKPNSGDREHVKRFISVEEIQCWKPRNDN